MKTRFDVHQEITNRIVAAIEAGAGEFKLPWHRAASTRSPINATTGRAYRGVNILSLWITTQALGYESHEWASFKQWQERGANVRKGEKGTPIIFYKNLHVESSDVDASEDAEGGRRIPFARASWVFNAAQVDGHVAEATALPESPLFERIASVDRVIEATGAQIEYGGSRACYNRLTDRISSPTNEPSSARQPARHRRPFTPVFVMNYRIGLVPNQDLIARKVSVSLIELTHLKSLSPRHQRRSSAPSLESATSPDRITHNTSHNISRSSRTIRKQSSPPPPLLRAPRRISF